MSILGRLALIEKAARRLRGPLPLRHFVTVDGGLSFAENTPAGGFDYDLAVLGCSGELPADLRRYTPADLATLERDGCPVMGVAWSAL